MASPLHPSLYQINTRCLLTELGRELGRPATLDDVPDATLDEAARLGFDWVWLLGVWQTGEAARAVSLSNPEWRREYEETLPDLTDADISGSPFAICDYTPHEAFGGPEALARLRARLADRGIRLLLDFVPNHTALDHRWVAEHPEFYVRGDEADLEREPQNYIRVETQAGPADRGPADRGPAVFAHGRDPYFPGWPDTLQLNYRHAGLRAAMRDELVRISEMADGVRCDMAMLLLPDVIERTWGERARPSDGSEPVDAPFWTEAIAAVRERRPDFLFMAEVYWDLEHELQQQGFDYTYDKRLYDRLRDQDARSARAHLLADFEFQRRSARFLENHDEPRAAATFAPGCHEAAAVVTFFVPGLRFFHEGKLDGRRRKVSMHLGRRPDEPPDPEVRAFYERLLACLGRSEVRDGEWRLLDARPAWDGNPTWERFVAYSWRGENGRHTIVTTNYGPDRGQCYVGLPFDELRGRSFLLRDLMSHALYAREGDDLATRGLFLDVPAWGYHVFEVVPVTASN